MSTLVNLAVTGLVVTLVTYIFGSIFAFILVCKAFISRDVIMIIYLRKIGILKFIRASWAAVVGYDFYKSISDKFNKH